MVFLPLVHDPTGAVAAGLRGFLQRVLPDAHITRSWGLCFYETSYPPKMRGQAKRKRMRGYSS